MAGGGASDDDVVVVSCGGRGGGDPGSYAAVLKRKLDLYCAAVAKSMVWFLLLLHFQRFDFYRPILSIGCVIVPCVLRCFSFISSLISSHNGRNCKFFSCPPFILGRGVLLQFLVFGNHKQQKKKSVASFEDSGKY